MNTDIATIAADAVEKDGRAAGARAVSPTVRKLFLMLFGAYGNTFAAKFSTGKLDEADGQDLGTKAAMRVWDRTLARFPGDVVETAAKRLVKENPEFPPSLGKLEAGCEAAMPAKDYFETEGVPRLPAPVLQPVQVKVDALGDGRDWARVIEARAAAGDKLVTPGMLDHALIALGKLARARGRRAAKAEGAAA